MIEHVGSLGFPFVWFFLIIGFVNMNITTMFGRFVEVLGNSSYSIYLLHPSVFGVFLDFLPVHRMPVYSPEFMRFVALGTVCLAAVVTWMFFEQPMIKIGRRLVKRADQGTTQAAQTAP
jgi:peptidoglycan/LPS O-acetylase OafA/YrhL